MKYQLIKEINENYSAIEQILYNRNIENPEHYLNTTDEDINSFLLLGEDALRDAATALIQCINEEKDAMLIVDSDCDGFTSSAGLINYLYDLFPAWVSNHLTWFMHEGKQHGLSDFPMEEAHKYELFLIRNHIQHKSFCRLHYRDHT